MTKLWFTAALLACAALGCSKGGGGGLKKRWLDKTWKPVSGDLEGTAFTAEIPDGLPQNKEALIGMDWWVGTGVDIDHLADAAGPRLSLEVHSDTYPDAVAWARHIEPDAKRSDLVEVATEKLPDGRLRYVAEVKGGSHTNVRVWIPIDADHGIDCTAHWWAGLDEHHGKAPPPDPKLIAWLDRFCASVHVGAK